MAVKRYRKKPVVIEAIKFTGNNCEEICLWSGHNVLCDDQVAYIPTPEGTMTTRAGNYIIKGTSGEFYPCRADIFEDVYEIDCELPATHNPTKRP